MIYALALAGCVKRTGEPGPASAFLRRGGFRDWGVTPDPEPLLVGSLGNRALVCASHVLSTTFLQVCSEKIGAP